MKTLSLVLFLIFSFSATTASAQTPVPAKVIYNYSPGSKIVVRGLGLKTKVFLPPPAAPVPAALPKMYFSFGGSMVYMNGTTFDKLGVLAGEAIAEFTFPLGKVRWAHVLLQPTFGGGHPGTMTGSLGAGLAFVLNGDPDVRPTGSTRLSLMFAMRGRGTGDSQDLLGLEGKLMADVAVGETGGIVWLIHAAFEGGGSVYQSAGQSQNDGRLFVGSAGFALRL